MREYGPGNPLVFSHIPKTAGTSLGAALQESLKPTVTVGGIDSSLFGAYDDVDALSPAARATVHLRPEDLAADATLVAGHIAPGTTMVRYPGADHITILRAPQVRLISQWLHGRAVSELSLRHWGPSADAFRASRLPLRDYLQHRNITPSIDNTITRFLTWPHPSLQRVEMIPAADDDQLYEAAIARLDAFGHVNVVENPDFIVELGAWLGRELPETHLNERTSVPKRWRADLDVELDRETRELLDHRCRIDTRVWTHVVGRALPAADPAQLLDETVQQAVVRYTEMLNRPYDAGLVRSVAQRVWEVGVQVRPGKHLVPVP